jgi:hypothetical protein
MDIMAFLKAADALRRLNIEHGCDLNYLTFHRNIIAGKIPAERADDGRSWQIDEADLGSIAARLSTATVRRTRSAA